ncbi:MAG TPA: hypothetical protein VH475_20805 [Tepidisphaeraceae bacterium]|jgi:hypothetical protein
MRLAYRGFSRSIVVPLMLLLGWSGLAGLAHGAGPAPAPANLNDLSLRVAALQAIYEFDLSPEQLRAMRGATNGAADTRQRTAAKGTPKLTTALKDLHEALLKQDGEKIAELRDQIDELQDDDNVDIDDAIHATDTAKVKAPDVLKRLKASQIAAYLSEHADEVGDPVEQMMDALAEIRDPDADDPDGEMQDTADDVGRLVGGLDAVKVKQVTNQVLAWFKAAKALKDDEFARRMPTLEEGAKRIVGDVAPMQVLAHWLENELAELLANPQMPGAIDAAIAARANANLK